MTIPPNILASWGSPSWTGCDVLIWQFEILVAMENCWFLDGDGSKPFNTYYYHILGKQTYSNQLWKRFDRLPVDQGVWLVAEWFTYSTWSHGKVFDAQRGSMPSGAEEFSRWRKVCKACASHGEAQDFWLMLRGFPSKTLGFAMWVGNWKCWVNIPNEIAIFQNGIMISKTIGYNGLHYIFRHTHVNRMLVVSIERVMATWNFSMEKLKWKGDWVSGWSFRMPWDNPGMPQISCYILQAEDHFKFFQTLFLQEPLKWCQEA